METTGHSNPGKQDKFMQERDMSRRRFIYAAGGMVLASSILPNAAVACDHDDHTDTCNDPHHDLQHVDYNDHCDEPHMDEPHDDRPHVNHTDYEDHSDWEVHHYDGHLDSYSDMQPGHDNHSDQDIYVDTPYGDIDHGDNYSDHGDDPYSDMPYCDVSHEDEPHDDAPHCDHTNHADHVD